jgi:hypothetical protein
MDDVERAVKRFRTLALLFFGNVKFAFKRLGSTPSEPEKWVREFEAGDSAAFLDRHAPIQPIEKISPQDTYLLGYIVEGEIRETLRVRFKTL